MKILGFDDSHITEGYISTMADLNDYYKYIPFKLTKDLIRVWVLASYNGGNLLDIYFPDSNAYNVDFKRLIGYIDLTAQLPKTGSQFAFDILKQVNRKVNLRQIESAKNYGLSFDTNKEDQANYPFKLSDIPLSVLEYLNVTLPEDANQMVLTDDVEEILRFYSGVSRTPGIDEEISKIIRTDMTDFNQLMKTNKWRFGSDLLKWDLIKKNLRVKISKVELKSETDVILLIDQSYSTANDPKYQNLYKSVLLHYYEQFRDDQTILTIYLFGHTIYDTIIIRDKQEILNFLQIPLEPIIDLRGWHSSLNYIHENISNSDVVLITDGTEELFDIPETTSNKWSVISTDTNNKLNALCNLSGGKFIQV